MIKEFFILIIIAVLLSLVNIGMAQVVEERPFEIDLPERYQIPGRLVADGTHFELNNSEYLNITAVSSEPIKLTLKSVPEIVTMHIEPIFSSISTQITLSGLVPMATYHKYEDDYHNLTIFTANANGDYTYLQDLTRRHFVFILPEYGTNTTSSTTSSDVKYINDNETGGDCTSIGIWDSGTKTCTLTTDFSGTIQIDSDYITLDGNGYSPSIHIFEKKGFTIKNLIDSHGVFLSGDSHTSIQSYIIDNTFNFKNSNGAISLPYARNITILNNKILNNNEWSGIYLTGSRNITITGNTIDNNTDWGGISSWDGSSENNIIDNTFNNNSCCILCDQSCCQIIKNNYFSNSDCGISQHYTGNTIVNNTFSYTQRGIHLDDGVYSDIIGNSFSGNEYGIYINPGYMGGDNIILDNDLSNNNYGIYIDSLDDKEPYTNNIISNNIFNNNYGIYILNAKDNLLYQNNLVNNIINNAYESLQTGSNHWDNGTIGNYWDDYEGNDANGNGIGDTPHPIPDGSSEDRYPLMNPYSPSPVYSVGQGAPDLPTKNHFIDAYNLNGGLTVLGNPTTEVHRAWGYLVQDFPGASGYAGGIIMYNPYKEYAYYIHGAIWERYYSLGGPGAKTDIEFELGPPVSDIEPYIHTQPPEISSHGTQFRYQNFEGGALDHNVDTGEVFEIHGTIYAKWKELGYADSELGLVTSDEREADQSPIGTDGRVSDFEGGHIHWHRSGGHSGESYETHGAIDVVYCSEDGSGGRLGFPVSDEYVNPSGYLQNDFEGGYITTTDGVNYGVYMNDDNEGPLVEITSPEDGFHTDEYRISISGTAYDDSGILNNEVVIMVDSDEWDYCLISFAPYDSTSHTWSIPNIPLGYGDNEIIIETWDNKYNRADTTISVYCNPPDFSFAHITDAHIDRDCNFVWDKNKIGIYCESVSKFISTLREVNIEKPAFIIDTGDCVEYDNKELFRRYMGLLDQYIDKDIGIYHTAGNHDRRNQFLQPTNLDNYKEIVKHRESVGSVKTLGDGYDDYYFEPDGYGHRFIGLESGEDYSQLELPPFSPEGSGIKTDQMNKLKEMDLNIPKIIFMHHPAINEGDDTSGSPLVLNNCNKYGGNDECIAFNRCEFIKYCTDYNVQLVLTGHTHKPYYAQVSNTHFIQTPSATKDKTWGIAPLDVMLYKHGYRLIDIKKGKAYWHPYTQTGVHPNVVGSLKCPAHLHAYDSQGRHTGLNASGGVEINIPDSFYIGRYNYSDPNETETILLYNTTEEYRFEIVANLTGEEKRSLEIESFNFTVEQQTDDTRTTIAHLNILLTENTTATLPINLTTTTYMMEIDHDGDGVTDETIDPNSTETDFAPMAVIIAPDTGSIYNVSEPVEFNGTGRDPEDGILTNFSMIWYSDINGVIGSGEQFSTANLSAGAHRITLMVNDSAGLSSTQYITLTMMRIPGDLDHDGNVTSADVRIALGIVFSGEYTPEADIDENGYINILDVRMIMQAAAGNIEI